MRVWGFGERANAARSADTCAPLLPQDATQLTILSSWLVEIYLNTLNTLRDKGDTENYSKVQGDFRSFLQHKVVRPNLDKPTTYDLIASHGNVEDLVFFATMTEDYERVITHHIQHGEYTQALEVLSTQRNIELYYR